MGTGGALLLCALLYLSSTVHPACSCPEISRVDCTGHEADTGWQPCWNHLFRCRNHRLEIKFGGREPPFKVIGRGQMDGLQLRLKVEDPPLNSVFAKTDCDFLYTFPQPGPLFHPPPLPTSTPSFPPPHDLQSFCKEYDYTGLFSKLMKGYQAGRCTTYDLYCRSKGLKEYSEDPALRNRCLPPDPAASPVLIWELSLENNTSETNMVSVGFSSRHLLDQSCFNCSVTSARCDSASAGSYTRGKKRARLPLWEGLTIGFSAAGGASILASLLLCIWCRRKMKKTPSSSTLLSQPASLETAPEKDLEEVVSINYPTHVFRYQELHEASDGFSRANEVDHGGHGAVYKGTLPDGRTVAIKRLYENSFKRAELFMNEIAILSGLRHPNLVRLYGCTSRHSRELLLVYEFIPNGTIADHVHGHRAAEGALTWPLRLRIAVETATALAYLHAIEPPIIHRDVKTKNILLDGDFHVKVADFGLSRLFPVAASHVSTVPQGTPGYVDPEYHRCYQLTDKSDVYSFGVVLAELISSKTAVDVTRIRHEINLSSMALAKIQGAALQELVDPKLGFETDSAVRRSIELVAELAMRCLQGDRDTRPTMDDVLGILRGIEDGLHQAEGEREVDHTAGDGMGLQKNCTAASPNSVIGKWSSTATTPDASG